MPKKFKLKFICPRYLTQHAGGAEVHCRLLAEQAAAYGHIVELWATCAVDPVSWANARKPESIQENGISIRLFETDARPELESFRKIEQKIASGETLSSQQEEIWLRNSVNSEALYQAIKTEAHQTDFFIFIPYLFGITLNGTRVCPEKSLLIPCLHHENFIHLQCMRELFDRVQKILFNAPPEMELAQRIYPLSQEKCTIVSLGFAEPAVMNASRFKEKYQLKRPYLTFAGRREIGKNFYYLLEIMRTFQKAYPDTLDFVTMGSGPVPLESTDRGHIHDFGFLPEQDKSDCMSGALFNCQPSTNESLSITVMESWLRKRPVLVNSRCNVTPYWVNLSRGGLCFQGYPEFEQTILYALEHSQEMNEMGKNGHFFVTENFNWPTVIDRLNLALNG